MLEFVNLGWESWTDSGENSVQEVGGGGAKRFPAVNIDKYGNEHIKNYFQNLHGKASKFLDFPQHSINCHLLVFKDRSTQNWERSSIKAALRYIREQQA